MTFGLRSHLPKVAPLFKAAFREEWFGRFDREERREVEIVGGVAEARLCGYVEVIAAPVVGCVFLPHRSE